MQHDGKNTCPICVVPARGAACSARAPPLVYSLLGWLLAETRFCDVYVCIHVPCRISVTFKDEKTGKSCTVDAPIGQHLLEVAHNNDIELEGVTRVAVVV